MIVSICLIINIIITKVNVRKRAVKWLVANVGTVILYIPWLTVFISQLQSVKEDYWIEEFTLSDLGDYATFVFGEFPGFFAIVYAIIVCAAIVLLIVRRKKILFFTTTPTHCQSYRYICLIMKHLLQKSILK